MHSSLLPPNILALQILPISETVPLVTLYGRRGTIINHMKSPKIDVKSIDQFRVYDSGDKCDVHDRSGVLLRRDKKSDANTLWFCDKPKDTTLYGRSQKLLTALGMTGLSPVIEVWGGESCSLISRSNLVSLIANFSKWSDHDLRQVVTLQNMMTPHAHIMVCIKVENLTGDGSRSFIEHLEHCQRQHTPIDEQTFREFYIDWLRFGRGFELIRRILDFSSINLEVNEVVAQVVYQNLGTAHGRLLVGSILDVIGDFVGHFPEGSDFKDCEVHVEEFQKLARQAGKLFEHKLNELGGLDRRDLQELS